MAGSNDVNSKKTKQKTTKNKKQKKQKTKNKKQKKNDSF